MRQGKASRSADELRRRVWRHHFLMCSNRSRLGYRSRVTIDTAALFRRLSGATANNTRVLTLFIDELTSEPIAIIESSGIPYSSANFGSR